MPSINFFWEEESLNLVGFSFLYILKMFSFIKGKKKEKKTELIWLNFWHYRFLAKITISGSFVIKHYFIRSKNKALIQAFLGKKEEEAKFCREREKVSKAESKGENSPPPATATATATARLPEPPQPVIFYFLFLKFEH